MGFLYGLFLTLLIIVSVLLIAAVLLQAGKGGGVAAAFGGASSSSDAIFGTRQAGNLLTRASWWLGGTFLALSFALQLASTRRAVPRSILDQTFGRPAAPATAPATGTSAPGATAPAPALPLEQAPPTSTSQPTP